MIKVVEMRAENLYKSLKGLTESRLTEEEVLEEIKKATPLEISKAERRLVQEEDLGESQLRDFCKVHLKAVEDKVEDMKKRTGKDHPLYTLISEHEEILKILDELEKIGEAIKNDRLGEDKEEKLIHLSEHLVEAEKHHDREEKVIFPRMEDKGITGPVRIMESDHETMRPKKKELKELSKSPHQNKERIVELIDFLVLNLRDHIFKENNIIYPSALEELEDWDSIKKEADEIGYCWFTPEDSGNDREGGYP